MTDAQAVDEKRLQLESLKRQCQAVEQLMMLASEEKRYLEHEKTVLKRKQAELQEQSDSTLKKLDEQVCAMQNMSITNEEQLRQRIKSLENKVAEAEEVNAALRSKVEETTRWKKGELQRLSDGIESLRGRLESRALECGVQLRNILLVQSEPFEGQC
ncbi:hypothetical protein TraAM80_02057 [Trypanosoma rangeli]|uniref:Uncharacterized protein n=1 Tax=Trypanosoma rangeli TaxID=5698 RepID=A0A3R7NY60_TRYRA|nr:uncharacterized protein TraAM80_02057 [Trypanosoma rangeli]RNF09575.1 hypothetical protein TraAM80_02057 [Trypanosoma rangeli]|eukprot:RNF09575.1 hypothetical protein TraAM80_02057 [Trypanosoma rangeli]